MTLFKEWVTFEGSHSSENVNKRKDVGVSLTLLQTLPPGGRSVEKGKFLFKTDPNNKWRRSDGSRLSPLHSPQEAEDLGDGRGGLPETPGDKQTWHGSGRQCPVPPINPNTTQRHKQTCGAPDVVCTASPVTFAGIEPERGPASNHQSIGRGGRGHTANAGDRGAASPANASRGDKGGSGRHEPTRRTMGCPGRESSHWLGTWGQLGDSGEVSATASV